MSQDPQVQFPILGGYAHVEEFFGVLCKFFSYGDSRVEDTQIALED